MGELRGGHILAHAKDLNRPHDLDVRDTETGCYCLRFPSPVPWEEFAGRSANGQLAAHMPDLNLMVAEKLSEWQLPASLAPSILSFLVFDFVERARPIFADDWHRLPAML